MPCKPGDCLGHRGSLSHQHRTGRTGCRKVSQRHLPVSAICPCNYLHMLPSPGFRAFPHRHDMQEAVSPGSKPCASQSGMGRMLLSTPFFTADSWFLVQVRPLAGWDSDECLRVTDGELLHLHLRMQAACPFGNGCETTIPVNRMGS